MKKYILLIIGFSIFLSSLRLVFAEPIQYDAYLSGATIFCDNPKAEWNKTPRSVGKIFYPELRSDSINSWMESQIASETSSLGRTYLREALDAERIGQFDGYKTLEVVQNVYHARMNTLFDCAVIESRINIIRGLQKSKALKNQSEKLEQLSNEAKKLATQQKQCLPRQSTEKTETTQTNEVPEISSREASTRMINTATFHYCHYRKYLSYLESNLNNDNTNLFTIDSQIGSGSGNMIPKNSDEYQRILLARQSQIMNEIHRADNVLPRAVQAFKEMERTYSAHLLLVIVYDDFVRLRDNLHKYMSATSQLFEKSHNAMSP